MENAEEVLQLLEEFSKIKPKDIPRELEDYLGYVAKTGDPVYQWTLVKHLFREKLLTVITDFYESASTVELPTCPNVEPFNYERMKTSLLERFDSFSSAPFTVQRICELLTNPRKEYNRADKYMRAIEKNILVVSTREPGSGKRSLECDSQTDTVLNGMPDIKSISDPGSLGLLHSSAELPFLGAPPASNDVTVETTELNTGTTINDRLGQDVKTDLNSLELANKTWSAQDSNHLVIEDTQDNIRLGLPASHSEIIDSGVPLNTGGLALGLVEIKSLNDSNCEVESELVTGNDIVSTPLITENLEVEESSDIFTSRPSCETVLPDSIDSSDSFQQCKDERQNKLENEEIGSVSDENEVSSTPGDVVEDRQLVQEEVEDPTDSEAEATDSNLVLDTESDASILADSEINSSDAIQTDQSNQITISEITDVKSDVLDLECNEITGTIDSPVSPEINNSSSHSDNIIDQTVNVGLDIEQSENPDSHPDSSNDVCLQDRSIVTESQKPESCIEADSVSESNTILPEVGSEVDENAVQCQTNDEISIEDVKSNSEVSSPGLEDEVPDKISQNPLETSALTSISADEAKSEKQFTNVGLLSENAAPNTEVQSSSEVANDTNDQEKREDTVIQSIPSILPDSQHQIEDISVDTNCEAEEEAMDVDDCSNQMMVSEGENEGEPMDQSDQLHS